MYRKAGIKNWKVNWKEGTLRNTITGKELLYFHFMLSKEKNQFIIETINEENNHFEISPTGIRSS